MVIKSSINCGSSDHLSKCSKLTDDKQHTAVLSSLVASVISEHKLLCLIDKPKSCCVFGRCSLQVSMLIM